MSIPKSTCSSGAGPARLAAAAVALLVSGTPALARAQACCAGGSAITPGRLADHEDELVGMQEKAGSVLGSYAPGGAYLPQLAGDSELDFEQDLFAAVRVLHRGQLALLVPLVETRRATPALGAQFGGGVGDVNLSARYDFIGATESHLLPGVALLAGVTVPTGRPPDAATPPLESNATGIGAVQLNAALALERVWGPWLVDATGIVAKRTPYGGETLGTQVTLLAACAYVFENDVALGLSASYAFEGDATSGGADVPDSAKSALTLTLSATVPLSDAWRLGAGLYANPPASSFGANQTSVAGITYTVIRSWS